MIRSTIGTDLVSVGIVGRQGSNVASVTATAVKLLSGFVSTGAKLDHPTEISISYTDWNVVDIKAAHMLDLLVDESLDWYTRSHVIRKASRNRPRYQSHIFTNL